MKIALALPVPMKKNNHLGGKDICLLISWWWATDRKGSNI